MPKCSHSMVATAVHVDTGCKPCPWPSASDPDHGLRIENKRTSSLHDVESHTVCSQAGAVFFDGAQDYFVRNFVISSGDIKTDSVALSMYNGSSGQTVEVRTATTYFDATQRDATDPEEFEGDKESINNAYELDLP